MAVTVTYTWPVAGTTAPTAGQMANFDTVVATVIAAADADTTATITHNMGITVAQLAAGFPIVTLTPILQAPAALSLWANTSNTTNTTVCTKATTASSGNAGAQLQVTVRRAHTIGL